MATLRLLTRQSRSGGIAEICEAARDWFRAPSAPSAARVREALPHVAPEFSIAAGEINRGVVEALRWGVDAEPDFAAVCDFLAHAAREITAAAKGRRNQVEEHLVLAQGWLGQARRRGRQARLAAAESPLAIEALKRAAVAERLLDAVERFDALCDNVSWRLVHE